MNYDEAHKLRRPLERHELESMFTYYVGAVTDDVLHHIDTLVYKRYFVMCYIKSFGKKSRWNIGMPY
jgi:hypothetical protein